MHSRIFFVFFLCQKREKKSKKKRYDFIKIVILKNENSFFYLWFLKWFRYNKRLIINNVKYKNKEKIRNFQLNLK